MAILSVDGLTTSFRRSSGWVRVVDNVSFAVNAGETLAIVGESGSGKSVTALSIMRLLPTYKTHVTGSVTLHGRELLTLSEREMQDVRGGKIAMIFQEPMTSLNPVQTVGQQIRQAMRRHRPVSRKMARVETIQLLDRVKIAAAERRVNDYPYQMSGGMLQRVMIAMALACHPDVLIADEPSTALDVTVQAEILELIKTLRDEEQMGVLFITHDMGVVAEIADRTAVMFRSRVLEVGSTEGIYANPKNLYTQALLSAVPKLGSMRQKLCPATFALTDVDTGRTHAERDMPAPTGHSVLEVRNLVTRFEIKAGILGRVSARVHAVEDVSFDVREGETLALVGESGSGKSTTGRSVLRLVDPVSGTIRVSGEDIMSMSHAQLIKQRQHMQIIFQDPFSSLNPRMRVGEAIAEPLLVHGVANRREARDRVATLMTTVGLEPDMVKLYPHEFSGGQRQRISIARALALDPRIIVADESVSALDVSIRASIVNLLMELQERLRIAYLFITHDMAVVERVSHRVAVMHLGEIVEIGTRAQVFDSPQHSVTQRLMEAVPIADPSRRHRHTVGVGREVESAVRPAGYVPPKAVYREHAPGHLVKEN